MSCSFLDLSNHVLSCIAPSSILLTTASLSFGDLSWMQPTTWRRWGWCVTPLPARCLSASTYLSYTTASPSLHAQFTLLPFASPNCCPILLPSSPLNVYFNSRSSLTASHPQSCNEDGARGEVNINKQGCKILTPLLPPPQLLDWLTDLTHSCYWRVADCFGAASEEANSGMSCHLSPVDCWKGQGRVKDGPAGDSRAASRPEPSQKGKSGPG